MISILITWRSDDPERIRLWDHCRPLWEKLCTFENGLELCVADDGVESGPFSRSVAFNRAFAQSTGDVVIIWGADMLPDHDAIKRAAEMAYGHGWSFVFDGSCALTADQTDRLIGGRGVGPESLDITYEDVPGVLAVRREVWEDVGGMDERFGAGYGYEDCALRNTLAARHGTVRSPDHTLVCLYHSHDAAIPADTNTEVFWSEYADLAPHLN